MYSTASVLQNQQPPRGWVESTKPQNPNSSPHNELDRTINRPFPAPASQRLVIRRLMAMFSAQSYRSAVASGRRAASVHLFLHLPASARALTI